MSITEFITTMNQWGKNHIPFLFMVDFEMERPLIIRLSDIDPKEILYDVNGLSNAREKNEPLPINIKKFPEPLSVYRDKFDKVFSHLAYGDTFLTNLTISTNITLDHSLRAIFDHSHAKYKLLYKHQFLVFSPETFVQIRGGKIFSYPMKGTIDASVEKAKEKILNDRKELAEHVTIVDLIRNDLSQVATNVTVSRFRYVEEVKTASKNLFQVSSEIVGDVRTDLKTKFGDILIQLLPAGSVSGAPKPKTLEIIKEVEDQKRGYYTGVFGCFDGKQLDSGVMIRFIEHKAEKYYYRSGGGITTQSVVTSEYQEAIDKVYVPVT
jgi:para-aminobenzoate synthetase component 1